MGGTGRWMLGVVLVAGCNADGKLGAPGSATMVRSQDGGAVYAVNLDEGSISRYAPRNGDVTTIPVGGEPTRIARAGNRLFVTLRTEGSLAVLEEDGETARVTDTIPVGAEPYGVAVTADGSRIYVAVSLEDRVIELDGTTFQELRSWSVLDEPRWVTLSHSEQVLFVASMRDGGFTRIDLESGQTSQVDMPEAGAGHSDGATMTEPSVRDLAGDLSVRITGDPAITPDGHTLAIPTLYVDNTTPVISDDRGNGGGYDAGDAAEVGRINPVLVLCDLDSDEQVIGKGKAVFLAVDAGRRAWRSYPSAALASPDSRYFVVSLEASDAVLVVDTHVYAGMRPDDHTRRFFGPNGPGSAGFWERPVTAIESAENGPRGLAFLDKDTLLLHDFLTRRIESIAWKDAVEANEFQSGDREGMAQAVPLDVFATSPELTPSALAPDILNGRKLFWSAVDERITSPKGGVSCATCHFDGRNDGLTWTFEGTHGSGDVSLQTPSLVGGVSETSPLTWSGDVDSVFDEALETSGTRMGGAGLTVTELDDIAAFVESGRLPITPTQDPDQVAEGKAIFERTDVACATCHSGPRFTDGLNHDILGESVQTPSLNGIAATAPYLHDGRARTLREVLAWSSSGVMGDTGGLQASEVDALEAFLRSL